jgi:hypothetical protein
MLTGAAPSSHLRVSCCPGAPDRSARWAPIRGEINLLDVPLILASRVASEKAGLHQ